MGPLCVFSRNCVSPHSRILIGSSQPNCFLQFQNLGGSLLRVMGKIMFGSKGNLGAQKYIYGIIVFSLVNVLIQHLLKLYFKCFFPFKFIDFLSRNFFLAKKIICALLDSRLLENIDYIILYTGECVIKKIYII